MHIAFRGFLHITDRGKNTENMIKLGVKKIVTVIMMIVISGSAGVFAQENHYTEPEYAPEVKTEQSTEAGKEPVSGNVNIDTKLMYGQYNNIYTAFSITQNNEFFTYQINSNLRRSNDFGYTNSAYYEGEIGFTGKADISDSWKLIPQVQVNNESHGMFDNSVYSREEKDRITFSLKNEYKPASSRWDFNLGTSYYVHRLTPADSVDSDSTKFFKFYEKIEWEYIWSASNKFGMKHEFSHYNYSLESADPDQHLSNELYSSFKLTEYMKLNGGFILDWDRDKEGLSGFFPSGKIDISSVGFKYSTIGISYEYDLAPFRPEDFYFQQKYILPTYDLPPGKVHRGEVKGDLLITLTGDDFFYLKKLKLKGKAVVEKNSDFYNYYSMPGDVLNADTIPVNSYEFAGNVVFDFMISGNTLSFDFNYTYSYYSSDENVTYRPSHKGGARISYSEKRWGLEWENQLRDEVYIEPNSDKKLDRSVIGNLGFQISVIDAFYLYAKIDNLYGNEYCFRYGYPEPGRTFLGGLRIIF